MSYEQAPQTKLVATHCCICGRDLVDAKSVESGIGPICEKKAGLSTVSVSEEARKEANALIYQAAILQKGVEFFKIAERLEALGFAKLAEILKERARLNVEVILTPCPEICPVYYRLEAPYKAEAVTDLKAIPGRYYNEVKEVVEGKEVKHRYNFVPVARKQALFDLIKRHYSGKTAQGPKGFFVIE